MRAFQVARDMLSILVHSLSASPFGEKIAMLIIKSGVILPS
jgi:hypothetical protein